MTKKQLDMKSTEDRLKDKLDKMAKIQEAIDEKQAEMKAMIEALFEQAPEIREQHNMLQLGLCDLQEDAIEVESEIKELGLKCGETIQGEKLQAVFNKGRRSWDGNLLESWAILLPAIMEAKKADNPYISLKEVKS